MNFELDNLRPYLSPIFPGSCFDRVVLDWEHADINCVKMGLIKALGFGMIIGGSLVKIPQIVKLLKAGSSEGLSIAAIAADLAGVTASTAYSFHNSFPFSSYGEGVFLMVETAFILALALFYSSKRLHSSLFVIAYIFLCNFIRRDVFPGKLLWIAQLMAAPAVTLGKLWQAVQNYYCGHTGQLSFVTMFLLFMGCIARTVTSLVETNDATLVLPYLFATVANGILVYQILAYWDITNAALNKIAKKKKQ